MLVQNKDFGDQIAALQSKLSSFEGLSKEIRSLQRHVARIEAEKTDLADKLRAVSANQGASNHVARDNSSDNDHGNETSVESTQSVESEECKQCPFGLHQSPIDIVTTADGASTVDLPASQYAASPLVFRYPQKVRNCSILNNGYTVQINIGEENECTVTVEGETFTLRQFHFHTPAEHKLDGQQHAMEMHLVHTTDDGKIAVLGFIFSVSERYQRCSALENDISFDHLLSASTREG